MIKQLVADLVERHGTNNPYSLAECLGIHIEYEPLGKKGAYFSNIYGVPIIHINSDISDDLALFACAHELGHALLHKDLNFSWLSLHTYHNGNKTEREANQFAVELLMPDDLIASYQDTSIYAIAAICGVPDTLVSLKKFA